MTLHEDPSGRRERILTFLTWLRDVALVIKSTPFLKMFAAVLTCGICYWISKFFGLDLVGQLTRFLH